MKALRIPRIDADLSSCTDQIGECLEAAGAFFVLEEAPWTAFPYKPSVGVRIGHVGSAICARFSVCERSVLAEKTATNSQVSEDSCVELFLAPESGGPYYNFEWSCIGTCLAGVGTERRGREFLRPSLIEQITRSSSLGHDPFAERLEETAWSLLIVLPVTLFLHRPTRELGGASMRGNFYKCGDHLSFPHYLTWNPIRSPEPDFHRPDQFGDIVFAP